MLLFLGSCSAETDSTTIASSAQICPKLSQPSQLVAAAANSSAITGTTRLCGGFNLVPAATTLLFLLDNPI